MADLISAVTAFDVVDEAPVQAETDTFLQDYYIFKPPNASNTQINTSNNTPIWPLAQSQVETASDKTFQLTNNETLFITVNSANVETPTLLQSSGLLALFENLKFNVEITTKHTSHAKIRLIIDNNMCQGTQTYTLKITEKCVVLIGSDSAGLLYACHSLVQHITHSSSLSVVDSSINSFDVTLKTPRNSTTGVTPASKFCVLYSILFALAIQLETLLCLTSFVFG